PDGSAARRSCHMLDAPLRFNISGSPDGSAESAIRRSQSMARLMTRRLYRDDRAAAAQLGPLTSEIVPANHSALRAAACRADNETIHPSPRAAGSWSPRPGLGRGDRQRSSVIVFADGLLPHASAF